MQAMDFGVFIAPYHPVGESPLITFRHDLELINGMHLDGRMDVPGLRYDGLPGVEARKLVVADLKAQGLLVKEEAYTHEVGHCDRCDAVIEPLVSEQWWLRMDKMRDKAVEVTFSLT